MEGANILTEKSIKIEYDEDNPNSVQSSVKIEKDSEEEDASSSVQCSFKTEKDSEEEDASSSLQCLVKMEEDSESWNLSPHVVTEEINKERAEVQVKTSCRYSSKAKKQLRLSAKRKKKGGRVKISRLPRASNVHCSYENTNIDSAPGQSFTTPPKKKKSLPLSYKRKKRRIPANLLIWNVERKKLNLTYGELPAFKEDVKSGFEIDSTMTLLPSFSPTHQCSTITIERSNNEAEKHFHANIQTS